MSLVSSIFGDASSPGGKKEGDGTLSDLFGPKSALPPRPNNVPAAPLPKKTSVKKKQRKKPKVNGTVDTARVGTTSESPPAEETGKKNEPTNNEGASPSLDEENAAPVCRGLVEKGNKDGNKTDRKAAANESASDVDGGSESGSKVNKEERTIFVGNLPPDTSRKALSSIFKKCGKVVSARLRSVAVSGVKLPPDKAGNQNLMRKICANTGKLLDDAPKKSAQGYVVFDNTSSVEEALKLNNTTYNSCTIRVDHATPTVEPSRSVFVGNLAYGTDEETLREHFANGCGGDDGAEEEAGCVVTSVRIIRDKETQKCKGFGYVAMRDASLVPAALRMHGSEYLRREIRVLVCGKRFKGKRGQTITTTKTRSFEGQRATPADGAGASRKDNALGKRKSPSGNENGGLDTSKVRKRKTKSEQNATRNTTSAKSGVSKRAAVEKKVNERVKKMQKRVNKGMGKNKK